MQRSVFPAFIVAVSVSTAAWAQPLSLAPSDEDMADARPILVAAQAPQTRSNLGGGFIEALFGGGAVQPRYRNAEPDANSAYANTAPSADPRLEQQLPGFEIDPRYLRQEVDYHGTEAPGTIVIDTPNKFLFLVEGGGRAMRYGVGVGRPGFTWSGMHSISAKKEWPDWVPPEEMLQRQPGLPDGGLIMCHPGHVDAELERLDSLTHLREREFAYFNSDAFPETLAEHGVALARP